MIQKKIEEICRVFRIPGQVILMEPLTSGHINTTYAVTLRDKEVDRQYVLQKVNIFVFKNPKRIMRNIERITTHIAEKLEAEGKSRDQVMHFLCTEYGNNYYIEDQGFWRVSEYVPNTVTKNSCESLGCLRSAGRAFGNFQTMLSDFRAEELYETIPDFHNTRRRIEVFFDHVKEDPCGRVGEVTAEIEKIRSMKSLACRLGDLVDAGALPLRVTHNDTKINNVLFDKDTGEAKTVIDLDTVMPGLVAYDFGDAIRYAANTSVEDEADLSLTSLDLDRFRAFSEGFIPEVIDTLTPLELQTLSLGAFTMTLELVVRFLDDYITGDPYFKTHYRGHNLVRARCQLRLAEDMLAHMEEMNRIVSEVSGISF